VALVLSLPTAAQTKIPEEVLVGLKIHQVTEINQKQENFGIAGTLALQWQVDQLAYIPESTEREYKTYTLPNFLNLLREKNINWPTPSFYNLQGKIDYQNQFITVNKSGFASYVARFTGTFQAPDFDFRKLPFDSQVFSVKLDLLRPNQEFVFKELENFSGLGEALGEEEWILDDVKSYTTTHNEFGENAGSRFILEFHGSRHLTYYLVRILIPALLIIIVSWITFFLKDYMKRIDIAGGNLLLFIAFNFTISSDLPKLGYLTLLDTFMLITFLITGFAVISNVWLRWLQNTGKEDFAEKIDDYLNWLYPITYIVSVLILKLVFEI
jgi:hypothetical protein